MVPLGMHSIVAETLRRLAPPMIAEYQAEMFVPDTWPAALGYGPWVEEVWVNYIGNAIRYGGRPPRVELGAEAQPDGMVRFWVRDNGSGLMPEARARLLVPFTQLAQLHGKGHGLGLSIVQRIVDRLGGQVGVDSEGVPGRGSVFPTLPRGRPESGWLESMLDFFNADLAALDLDVAPSSAMRAERQARKLILIPSESQAPAAVREALGSVFQNIYAEGYPDPGHARAAQKASPRLRGPVGEHRRHSDLRYYKGGGYVDVLESLARRRAAESLCHAGDPTRGDLGQRPAPLGLAGQQRRLRCPGAARQHGHGHGPAARRPPHPRQPGQPLGQAVQHRLLWHRPGHRTAGL